MISLDVLKKKQILIKPYSQFDEAEKTEMREFVALAKSNMERAKARNFMNIASIYQQFIETLEKEMYG